MPGSFVFLISHIIISSFSSTMSSPLPPPPAYAALNANNTGGNLKPPPYRRRLSQYNIDGPRRNRGGLCFKLSCCCLLFLVILIFALAGFALYMYVIYEPNAPEFHLARIEVKNSNNNHNAAAKYAKDSKSLKNPFGFVVTLKVRNLNKIVGFDYGHKATVDAIFKGTKICSGQFPSFQQSFKNTTRFKVFLKTNTPLAAPVYEDIQKKHKEGNVPLLVAVKTPASVVLGKVVLRQVKVYANTTLVLDGLSPGKAAKIKHSTLKQGYEHK